MELKSQICTTEGQSERLLALGLKKETADMRVCNCVPMPLLDVINGAVLGVPAWSLHRLIELMPTIVNPVRNLFVSNKSVEYQMSEGRTTNIFVGENNVYDNIINCMEWLIKEGHFNKEYLEA